MVLRTVVHDVRHADEKEHANATHEDHGVLEDGQDGDCRIMIELAFGMFYPFVVSQKKRRVRTLWSLGEVVLGPQGSNLDALALAAVPNGQGLTLVVPLVASECLPGLEGAVGGDVDAQRAEGVGCAVNVDQVRRRRRDVAKDEGVERRHRRLVPRAQRRQRGVRRRRQRKGVRLDGEVQRQVGSCSSGGQQAEDGEEEAHGGRLGLWRWRWEESRSRRGGVDRLEIWRFPMLSLWSMRLP